MTTLDGGVIIKKGTAPTPPSGGGEVLEGEYFLAKPNGRYWKFTFMPEEWVGLKLENFESSQIDAMYQIYNFLIILQCVYGAAASSDDLYLPNDHARLDGFYNIGARMDGTLTSILLYKAGYDYDAQYFNRGFLRVWKECDIKSNPPVEYGGLSLNSCSLVEFIKILGIFEGVEMTDDETISFIEQEFMLIPATEEEYKYWRLEDEE